MNIDAPKPKPYSVDEKGRRMPEEMSDRAMLVELVRTIRELRDMAIPTSDESQALD
jgi:hypothetical protein